MSPRSEEFMAEARSRLAGARNSRSAGDHAMAAGAAYYAMLYAARAALSERDLHAKTHSGTWNAFGAEFVSPGGFDQGLAKEARRAQRVRELGDYEARSPSADEAAGIVDVAARFIDAVERLI